MTNTEEKEELQQLRRKWGEDHKRSEGEEEGWQEHRLYDVNIELNFHSKPVGKGERTEKDENKQYYAEISEPCQGSRLGL